MLDLHQRGLSLKFAVTNAELHSKHSTQWQEFANAVLNEEHWVALWPAVEAVNRAAGPGVHSNGSIQLDAALVQ